METLAKVSIIFRKSKFWGKKLPKKYFHKPCESTQRPIFDGEVKKIIQNLYLSAELFIFAQEKSMNDQVSVLMINAQGIMISVQGCDYFLSYNRIPWMQDAPIRSVLNVKMSGPEAIEWSDLDVDLEIESLRHPERYPLVIKRNPMDFVGV